MATFRATIPEIFEDRQAFLVFQEFEQLELMWPQVFKTKTVTKGHDDAFKVSGLGTFSTKPEGTPISYDDPVQGPRVRVIISTFALGFRVTMEAREDEQFDLINEFPKDLGGAARDHQENLAFGLLNNGFGTTNTGLDGLALYTTAHTLLKAPSGTTTLSNRLSPGLPLSVTGLESAITNMRLTRSEEGRQTPLRPSKLVHHPDEEHNVGKLLLTDKEPFTSENQTSMVSSSQTGIVNISVPYLTDTDAWSLLASKHGLTWLDRKGLTMDNSKDAQTKDALFDAHYRATIRIYDWRGAVGSQP